ncbi:hypothetical protein M91_21677 [Bos mutus]|uniref:Ergosterol biosynthetic protein 28 n=1 Tax=Bos mutus TaxID=72004 RepID=L8IVH2_9CETA|nr:hypothetical protein M91_21677 [Bos mutus]
MKAALRDQVNGLQARTFGVWTLLSSVVRCLCAIDIHNKTLYYITLWTFFIGMGHLLFELFVFGTVAPMIFILAILTVANVIFVISIPTFRILSTQLNSHYTLLFSSQRRNRFLRKQNQTTYSKQLYEHEKNPGAQGQGTGEDGCHPNTALSTCTVAGRSHTVYRCENPFATSASVY